MFQGLITLVPLFRLQLLPFPISKNSTEWGLMLLFYCFEKLMRWHAIESVIKATLEWWFICMQNEGFLGAAKKNFYPVFFFQNPRNVGFMIKPFWLKCTEAFVHLEATHSLKLGIAIFFSFERLLWNVRRFFEQLSVVWIFWLKLIVEFSASRPFLSVAPGSIIKISHTSKSHVCVLSSRTNFYGKWILKFSFVAR